MARKPYKREMSKTTWFLTHSRYKHYMLHEISSVFVALYCLIVIWGLFALAGGPDSWANWIGFVASPFGVILHLIMFAFSVVMTIAWFGVVPQAMRIQQGEDFVPGQVIIGAHYAGLAAVSAFILILAGVA